MSNQAPAIGGASTSSLPSNKNPNRNKRGNTALPQQTHAPLLAMNVTTTTVSSSKMNASSPGVAATTTASAWQPYSILPPSTRRKIDPKSTILSRPYLESLNIPPEVAQERLANKYLQLDPPESGKETERRKVELAIRAREKDKRKVARIRKEGCGLVGRRRQKGLMKNTKTGLRYEALLPIHYLWLGYMSELLGIPFSIPETANPVPSLFPTTDDDDSTATLTHVFETSTLYPMFSSRQNSTSSKEMNVNVGNMHAKLVKAEFVGCILTVKRAKNPSLLRISGLVLQETQGTFKVVTSKSQVKILPKQGSIFSISLPLELNKQEVESGTKKELSLDLFGDQFAYRSAERVGKKWKAGVSAGSVQL